MKTALAMLIILTPLTGLTAPCNEACLWIRVWGSAGYACVTGTSGRHGVSTGTTCAIITSCRLAAITRSDGTILRFRDSCATVAVQPAAQGI